MSKKSFFKIFVFVLFTSAIVVGVNINLNRGNVSLSDLALSNIEVLAQSEIVPLKCDALICPGGCCNVTSVYGTGCGVCCGTGGNATCNATWYTCSCG